MSEVTPVFVLVATCFLGVGWTEFGRAAAHGNMVGVAILGPVLGALTLAAVGWVLTVVALALIGRGERIAKSEQEGT